MTCHRALRVAGARHLEHHRRHRPRSSTSCAPRRCSLRDDGRRRRSVRSTPSSAGIVPGVGRFDPCPWGLGVEIRGEKSPHWTGRANSPATFGHFGGAGTMMWVDPLADVGVVALTDRPFDEWRDEALPSVARVLRRSARRDPRHQRGRRMKFQPGDRVRWETHRRRRPPDGAVRVRRRLQRRREPRRGDARRRSQGRHRDRPRPARSRSPSPTSSCLLHGADLLDDPSLRQGLVNLWSAEADQAGLEIRAIEYLGTGVRDSVGDGFALAELHSGGRQYVLRAVCDATNNETVHVRADLPRRWEIT